MRVLVLANPSAHGGRAARHLPHLEDYFRQQTQDCSFRVTASAPELQAQAREAAEAGVERVLVAGGDGTAHLAVNALAGSETALGILPLGNGNDLACSLGTPRDPYTAADYLLRAPVSTIDLVDYGAGLFAGIAGTGYDSETNRRANAWPAWPQGHLRYWLAGFVTFFSFKPQTVDLSVDGEAVHEQALWVVFGNTPRYGGGIRILPEARPDDGRLDLCIVRAVNLTELLDLYPALYDGRHLGSPHVRFLRASRVEFRQPDGWELYGDGERLGRAPFTLQVVPKALRVVGWRPAA